ncbi:polyprenyl synthetase family protein [Mesonia aestuariivivens]|uniref:Polyprenyl synthetase family protein n=1 Tax=Mesonia aestuariivivens TaxID=2796128 RepID=A0ABS6W202_9FLAO|nr:polyprenyl synthetase family protein [Mesonia aestuariivivens]MBW2961880.1 polyprenyl synthetase family protein [Mesonia aestuariivivens]
MSDVSFYREEFLNYLESKMLIKEPENLYAPISYILKLGGKRLRPVLVLLSTEAFGVSYKKALDAALAIEVFHNFSLVHDDIMDDAPLRRGQKTVHEKWDLNTGILSGDAMLIKAYQLFENYSVHQFKDLAKLFSRTAIEVCEGQQYDIDFETREDVSIQDYLKMIEYKTAVLVGASLEMGAIVAEASSQLQKEVYEYGRLIGIAFQLQDDYLDAFGNPENFGKRVGGDIIENKKTFLYLKALEHSSEEDADQLRHLYTIFPSDAEQKIETVKHLFETSGAAKSTQDEIFNYTQQAFEILENLAIKEEQKKLLKELGESLLTRTI